MPTPSQVIAARATAGAAYAAALAELRTAWIDLKKHDIACDNRSVGAPVPVRTFHGAATLSVECLRHPEFAAPNFNEWEDAAKVAARSLIASVS